MIYRQIVSKERFVGVSPIGYEKQAYLKALQQLDVNKAYTIWTSRVKLTPYEVDDIAQQHKRADGQYIYYGRIVSRDVMYKKIYEESYVFQVEAAEVNNLQIREIAEEIKWE